MEFLIQKYIGFMLQILKACLELHLLLICNLYRPKLRYKDTVKANLQWCHLNPRDLEGYAMDRPKCCCQLRRGSMPETHCCQSETPQSSLSSDHNNWLTVPPTVQDSLHLGRGCGATSVFIDELQNKIFFIGSDGQPPIWTALTDSITD